VPGMSRDSDCGPDGDSDCGAVTAEAAVVLPVLVGVLSLCLGGIAAAAGELRCVDAARTAARALARGEPERAAVAAARAEAPSGAAVRVSRTGTDISVSVTARVGLVGLRRGPTIRLGATEHAEAEPGVTADR
jgi:hypothetical protein